MRLSGFIGFLYLLYRHKLSTEGDNRGANFKAWVFDFASTNAAHGRLCCFMPALVKSPRNVGLTDAGCDHVGNGLLGSHG